MIFLTGFWLLRPFQIARSIKNNQFPLIRTRFRFFSTRFVQDSMFFSIFDQNFRPFFPPVCPFPIENPYSRLLGIIPPYRFVTALKPPSSLPLLSPHLIRVGSAQSTQIPSKIAILGGANADQVGVIVGPQQNRNSLKGPFRGLQWPEIWKNM